MYATVRVEYGPISRIDQEARLDSGQHNIRIVSSRYVVRCSTSSAMLGARGCARNKFLPQHVTMYMETLLYLLIAESPPRLSWGRPTSYFEVFMSIASFCVCVLYEAELNH